MCCWPRGAVGVVGFVDVGDVRGDYGCVVGVGDAGGVGSVSGVGGVSGDAAKRLTPGINSRLK